MVNRRAVLTTESEARKGERARRELRRADKQVRACLTELSVARARRAEAARALHSYGWSLQRLGNEMGVTRAAVYKMLNRED